MDVVHLQGDEALKCRMPTVGLFDYQYGLVDLT